MAHFIYKLASALTTVFAVFTLAACGPGTGGTGTGPISNAPSTNSSAGQVALSTPIDNSAATGLWISVDSKTSVLLAADKITVVSNCIQFTFAGAWAMDASLNIFRQNDVNSLLITFTNQQLSFAIRNAVGEIFAAGTGLNKAPSEAVDSFNQCSNV